MLPFNIALFFFQKPNFQFQVQNCIAKFLVIWDFDFLQNPNKPRIFGFLFTSLVNKFSETGNGILFSPEKRTFNDDKRIQQISLKNCRYEVRYPIHT